MPLFQNQLESHVVVAEGEGRGAAEFRPIVTLAFVAGVLIPGSIALVEHGIATWIAVVVSLRSWYRAEPTPKGTCLAARSDHHHRNSHALGES